MEKYIEENFDAILEIATVIHSRLGGNPEMADEILKTAEDLITSLGENPLSYKKGLSQQRTADGRHTLLGTPDSNEVIEFSIHRTKDVIEIDKQAEVLAREHRKTAKNKTFFPSGSLPNGPHVKTLWFKGEGELTDDDLLNPSYEGGMVYAVLLEACHMNFAIGNEVIKNVPVPPTVFIARVKKVLDASEVGGTTVNNEAFAVTRVYAVCLDNGNFITDESRTYDWPFGNVTVDTFGWMCLGNNFSNGALKFPDAPSIGTLPHVINSNLPTSGHYGIHLEGHNYRDLIKLLKDIQGKEFPMHLLKRRGKYGKWVKSVNRDMYGK